MFKEELKALTEQVPGAQGALIMGLDGIAVDRFSRDDTVNLEALAAEYLSLVKKLRETSSICTMVGRRGAGAACEWRITPGKH